MTAKTKIALAVALILGPASAALASENANEERGGGPVQTWQDIARDAQGSQIKKDHTGAAQASYGYAKPVKVTRHEPSQDR
jgi:hypothetical protein